MRNDAFIMTLKDFDWNFDQHLKSNISGLISK